MSFIVPQGLRRWAEPSPRPCGDDRPIKHSDREQGRAEVCATCSPSWVRSRYSVLPRRPGKFCTWPREEPRTMRTLVPRNLEMVSLWRVVPSPESALPRLDPGSLRILSPPWSPRGGLSAPLARSVCCAGDNHAWTRRLGSSLSKSLSSSSLSPGSRSDSRQCTRDLGVQPGA